MKFGQNQSIVTLIIINWLIITPILMSSLVSTGSAYTYQFTTDSYVQYEINYEIDFSVPIYAISNFKVWIARLQNYTEQANEYEISLQESQIKNFPNPSGINEYNYDPWDVYNNSYDYYQKMFSLGDRTFHFSIKYDLTLSGASWDIPSNLNLTDYDTNSDLYKFYTSAQPYCESNESVIIDRANQIAGSYNAIVDKARAIYMYIVESMQYQVLNQAIGAKNASLSLIGDCSEFSSLMVALLRAQGIPARKVIGFGLVTGDIASPSPLYSPKLGQTLNYSLGNDNLPGHAWVQYYVPNHGWVTADPTWGQAFYNAGSTTTQKEQLALEYFNRIDYNHLITSIGDWYGAGIDPPIEPLSEGGLSEFPYAVIYGSEAGSIDFSVDFKVIDFQIASQRNPLADFFLWAVVGGTGALILVILFVAYSKRRSSIKNRY